jgi:hypothetical protein
MCALSLRRDPRPPALASSRARHGGGSIPIDLLISFAFQTASASALKSVAV